MLVIVFLPSTAQQYRPAKRKISQTSRHTAGWLLDFISSGSIQRTKRDVSADVASAYMKKRCIPAQSAKPHTPGSRTAEYKGSRLGPSNLARVPDKRFEIDDAFGTLAMSTMRITPQPAIDPRTAWRTARGLYKPLRGLSHTRLGPGGSAGRREEGDIQPHRLLVAVRTAARSWVCSTVTVVRLHLQVIAPGTVESADASLPRIAAVSARICCEARDGFGR